MTNLQNIRIEINGVMQAENYDAGIEEAARLATWIAAGGFESVQMTDYSVSITDAQGRVRVRDSASDEYLKEDWRLLKVPYGGKAPGRE